MSNTRKGSSSSSSRISFGSYRTRLFVGLILAILLVVSKVVRPSSSSSSLDPSSYYNALQEKFVPLIAGGASSRGIMALQQQRQASQQSLYEDEEITCDAVNDHVVNKSWHDPNDGTYLIRRTRVVNDNEPTFFISVHKKEYDPLRHETIFERGRYYEHKVIQRFNTILRQLQPSPNSIVLDVGGNIGYYSLLSAAHHYQVVSFEINPANIIRFCESASMNRFTNRIHIIQRGVSAHDGTPLHVYVPPHNPGEAQMIAPGQMTIKSPGNGQMVDITSHAAQANLAKTVTVTLDQFAEDHGWFDTPGFSIPILKMDIEGHEPFVIDGARRLLASGLIKNILTEFRWIEKSPQKEAIQHLLDAGYVAVDHPNRRDLQKYNTSESTWEYLKGQDEHFRKTRQNTDLWFQLASEELPAYLLP